MEKKLKIRGYLSGNQYDDIFEYSEIHSSKERLDNLIDATKPSFYSWDSTYNVNEVALKCTLSHFDYLFRLSDDFCTSELLWRSENQYRAKLREKILNLMEENSKLPPEKHKTYSIEIFDKDFNDFLPYLSQIRDMAIIETDKKILFDSISELVFQCKHSMDFFRIPKIYPNSTTTSIDEIQNLFQGSLINCRFFNPDCKMNINLFLTVCHAIRNSDQFHDDQNQFHDDQNQFHDDQNQFHDDQNQFHNEQNDLLSTPSVICKIYKFMPPYKISQN